MQVHRCFVGNHVGTQQAKGRACNTIWYVRLTVYRAQSRIRIPCAVFHLIDRKPLIDSGSDAGVKPDGEVSLQLPGPLELRDVHFSYPSRPHNPVLRGVSLTIHPGQKVALVGPSGCGKAMISRL